ncbi:MAG: dolichyl-phosphate beta-D-mannosyltransferase [Bdellovibrio sp.]|nr:MAG: dolichyl-phosphate beta-D-mannosyltransferase [Bdellovibrio sp.]
MRTLILVPTYNERENVKPIAEEILLANPAVEILFIDDNSPDRTAEVIEAMQSTMQPQAAKIHILKRPRKEGLGRAYLAGFAWGLARKFDCLVEMDADFSHRPVDLVSLRKAVDSGVDFAVGSRYVAGGSTVNWGLLRKLISRGGSLYARLILGYPLHDWTGGFNAWRASTLERIGLSKVTSNGYSFQIELKYRALREGFRGIEVPIVFEERRVGKSKMSLKIVLEAFYRVWQIRCI